MDLATSEINRVDLLKSAIHELRSPLAAIFDLTDTILATKSNILDEQTVADVTEIQSSAQRVLSVVDTVVELMRVEIADRRCVNTDVRLPIQEAVRRTKETFDSHNQRLRVSVAPELPNAVIDPDCIVQTTAILLSHASQFMPRGEEFSLSVRLSEAFITISIGATTASELCASEGAIQIPAKYVKGVFGLELLTVDRVMALHNGKFWLNKDADDSLRYHYRLPVALVENQNEG